MKIIFLISFMLMGTIMHAQVQLAWFNFPGGVAVATDVSNNVYTANWESNPGGDITLTKRDAGGNIIWEVSYDNIDETRHEVATWVETDGAGNILVSGTIRSGYSNPVNAASLLMKYSPAGTLLWRVVYESSFEGSSTRKCLVDVNNNIYVLGIGTGPNGQVTKVKKFNPSGVPVWNYFDSGIGAPINFKFTPDNNIVIIHRGITGSINGYSKIDLAGNLIWSYAGVNSLTVGDAAGDGYGNTYLINGEYVVTNAGSIITKLSPTGAVIWSHTNTMKGNRVEVGTDNNPVVSGYPYVGYGAAFIKYDNAGNVLWQNLDADGASLALLSHAQLKLDGSNAAYLAGSTMSLMGVCKVNSDGTSAWTATTSSGYAVCLDFGTDNSVFVTGGTTARFIQSGFVPVPEAPTNLTAIATGTTSVNLAWTDNATNETNYVVQRSLSATSGFTNLATLAANTVSYSNTGLNSSTTYYYKVQATNASGSSAWSNVVNATTPSSGPPNAPTSLVASANLCNSIHLTWIDNSINETNFELRRSLTSGGNYITVATLAINTTAYTNTGLTRGRKYYYQVRAVNPTGYSVWSNTAYATASCPKNLKAGAFTDITELIPEGVNKPIELYPNPSTNGFVNLILPSGTTFPVIVQLYSMTGQKVMQKELNDYINTIDTNGLNNGVYFLNIFRNGKAEKIKLQILK